jgi:hypothetical protein
VRNHRNLLRRPPKPALGNGRIQKQAKVALWIADGEISTRDAMAWTHAKKVLLGIGRITDCDYELCRRALAAVADPVGRAGGRGRPTIWRARNMEEL